MSFRSTLGERLSVERLRYLYFDEDMSTVRNTTSASQRCFYAWGFHRVMKHDRSHFTMSAFHP
jgi:hypothetical protein